MHLLGAKKWHPSGYLCSKCTQATVLVISNFADNWTTCTSGDLDAICVHTYSPSIFPDDEVRSRYRKPGSSRCRHFIHAGSSISIGKRVTRPDPRRCGSPS